MMLAGYERLNSTANAGSCLSGEDFPFVLTRSYRCLSVEENKLFQDGT